MAWRHLELGISRNILQRVRSDAADNTESRPLHGPGHPTELRKTNENRALHARQRWVAGSEPGYHSGPTCGRGFGGFDQAVAPRATWDAPSQIGVSVRLSLTHDHRGPGGDTNTPGHQERWASRLSMT